MTDLVIRYVHGVRMIRLDHGRAHRHEQVLHDRARERRISLPPAMAGLKLKDIVQALQPLWHDSKEEQEDHYFGA